MTALIFAVSDADNWIGLAIAVLIAVYLVLALVFPERF